MCLSSSVWAVESEDRGEKGDLQAVTVLWKPLCCHPHHRTLHVCISHNDLAFEKPIETCWSPRVQGCMKCAAPSVDRKVGRERKTPPSRPITPGRFRTGSDLISSSAGDAGITSLQLFISVTLLSVIVPHSFISAIRSSTGQHICVSSPCDSKERKPGGDSLQT